MRLFKERTGEKCNLLSVTGVIGRSRRVLASACGASRQVIMVCLGLNNRWCGNLCVCSQPECSNTKIPSKPTTTNHHHHTGEREREEDTLHHHRQNHTSRLNRVTTYPGYSHSSTLKRKVRVGIQGSRGWRDFCTRGLFITLCRVSLST